MRHYEKIHISSVMGVWEEIIFRGIIYRITETEGADLTFNLLIIGKDGTLQRYTVSDWTDNIAEKKKKSPPSGPEQKTTVKFISVDITDNAALAKIELRTGGKHIYTDYLSLYRFQSGWRIVSKIYYQHN